MPTFSIFRGKHGSDNGKTVNTMKRVYTAKNLPDAGLVKAILDAAGIACVIDHTQLQSVMSGGAGVEAAASVSVNEGDFEKAEALVKNYLDADDSEKGEDWTCEKCGETHAAQFKACWKCAQ